ncbi:MAG: hypothetical protein LBK97_06180 [Prevotellaceae bacterium]|nr:hypothetical protein [Prevotellaceae bacterium]
MTNILKELKSSVFSLGIIFIGMISAGIFMQSCSQDDDLGNTKISENEQSLNLTAPNGEKIAENIYRLKEIVSVSVAEKFGIDKEFCITSLKYIPVQEGYSVLIKYETSDNLVGGLIRTNSHSFTVAPGMKVWMPNRVRLKSEKENSAKWNGKTITCTADDDDCTCMPSFTTTSGSSGVSYTCEATPDTCECSMTVSY